MRTFISAVFIVTLAVAAFGQSKKIAFTIDDLPLNGPDIGLARLKSMTSKLIGVTTKNKIPMVGFVNESLLFVPNETDARIAVLKMWTDAGLELGNHTFSHRGFANTPISEFEDEFVRGQTITSTLMKPKTVRWFRHPFLQMGPTRELELAFRDFMTARGVTAVPVTTDSSDWMFLNAYEKALAEKDEALKKRVVEAYLKIVGERLAANERNIQQLAGRAVPQIMLLHANELNADNFDAVVAVFKKQGYEFVTVEEAMKDEFYKMPDNSYATTSFWPGQWAKAKGAQIESVPEPEFIRQIFGMK